jgi:beta-mannanase
LVYLISASDGTDIKLSEMALAIVRMEQQLNMLTNVDSNVAVTAVKATKQMSTKQIIETMSTSENRVVAATLHNTRFDNSNCDSKFDSNSNVSDSATMSTDTGTSSNNSNDGISVENNVGIGPMLDITAYNRFESTLAKLQVNANDIVRVDNQAIGTGGFAKVYKVLLKGNQVCAAKVSCSVSLLIHFNQPLPIRYVASALLLRSVTYIALFVELNSSNIWPYNSYDDVCMYCVIGC